MVGAAAIPKLACFSVFAGESRGDFSLFIVIQPVRRGSLGLNSSRNIAVIAVVLVGDIVDVCGSAAIISFQERWGTLVGLTGGNMWKAGKGESYDECAQLPFLEGGLLASAAGRITL